VKTTVVGIGNVLLGDDGVGVWLVQRLLSAYTFEPEIEILDGGTLGLGLVTYLSDTDRLLIIDAASTGAVPGTVVVLRERDIPAILRATLSAHEASLCDLLAALTLLGRTPGEFVAIGIEPQNMIPSIELSTVVRDALEQAEREVVAQLGAWGIAAEALDVPRQTVLSL
jgi:hydrogenase maturation protease